MRLDKFIAENTGLTRSQAARALKSGLVTVNGKLEKSGSVKIGDTDEICYEGERLEWVDEGQYFMLYSRKAMCVRMMTANIRPYSNFLTIR
ncbi:16S rRNA pseudouridylate synthase [Actinobacillus pleuropneumoniae]|nr:16S rRNA pseudouridylate synthase [Actinobacillus pleuropneumoniae]KIE93322.1 16S rRNA pseudouridylate synthase [Actinobacillus pleuropneumoniae]KIE98338.1 16S rRNA pseudouridylate synthase [Actinobacillus pleuropneumoniae]